jgi:lipopolysaccharide biosynthesis protein
MPIKKIRPIAIYLPQFHPIPENDEWWGKGFTEWRNVVKSKPRFKGHYQPHLPADLGFYDLRLEEARLAQEALAKHYGIYGFCYYHYWFNGKRLLNEPIDRKMNNPKEDLPFMFCWANENWTRAWDGGEHEILIEQKYSHEDDVNHIRALIPYFKDERYITVDGKPVFIIYKDALFPDIKQTLEIFKEEAGRLGMELYLCRFDRQRHTQSTIPTELGFDAAIEFQPLSLSRKELVEKSSKGINKYLLLNNYLDFLHYRLLKTPRKSDKIVDYKKFVEFDMQHYSNDYKTFPCVSPGWDNSSRRPRNMALIFKNSDPVIFKKWIVNKLSKFIPFSKDENFLFINAWNEWAEGNHLEPCEKYGHSYLIALYEALPK